jgi:sialate O-acetylesterase
MKPEKHLSFTVAPVFSDYMILQRDKPVRIFGTGEEGRIVAVQIHTHTKTVTIKNGTWLAELPQIPEKIEHTLTICCGDEKITYSHILAGEVWIAGGQSNMQYQMDGCKEKEKHIADSSFPDIRWYDTPRIASGKDEIMNTPVWRCSNPQTSPSFSAVAQFFARKIHTELDCPVGIIGCNWGGTPAETWMSRFAQSIDPDVSVFLNNYNTLVKNMDEDEYNKQWSEFKARQKAKQKAVAAGTPDAAPFPGPPPLGPRSWHRPAGLYTHMLKTLVPLCIKGVIWYQGESNANGERGHTYAQVMNALINNWREDFSQGDFPFYLVQLPGYGTPPEEAKPHWPMIRESILTLTKTCPNTGVAIAIDCGEEEDIHPSNKEPVGTRLALLALEDTYNKNISGKSPVLSRLHKNKNEVLLSFNSTKSGLTLKNSTGFELILSDDTAAAAEVSLHDKKTLKITNIPDSVKEIRYAWAPYPEVSLYADNGLPASPFSVTL